MIPELGHFALIVALCIACVQAALPLIGSFRRDVAWMELARPAAAGQFVFVAVAFGCLAWSFVTNDFSVLNVATNSNSHLPVHYRFAATWGSHAASHGEASAGTGTSLKGSALSGVSHPRK